MTKKLILLLLFVTPLCSLSIMAGGLMTNTNYHIAFDRMFARGATSEIDAAYSNPAGLAWGHEGWQLSLNFSTYCSCLVCFIQKRPLGNLHNDRYCG